MTDDAGRDDPTDDVERDDLERNDDPTDVERVAGHSVDAGRDDDPTDDPGRDSGSTDDPTDDGSTGDAGAEGPAAVQAAGVTARYYETGGERILEFERDGRTAAIAQNAEGYAMLKVRPTADGDELERYYGFDVALDHAAELLGVAAHDLPVPEPAEDMGM